MTFAADFNGHEFNLVVRALVFLDGHLLVSRWKGGYCFPVGGRIEFGESLGQAVEREWAEETGARARSGRLVYFNENFFRPRQGNAVHELGWYFWVEPERAVGHVGDVIPHPDSGDLVLEYIPLDRLAAADLVPPFLVQYLPVDFARGFAECPRHVVSVEQRGSLPQVRDTGWLLGHTDAAA
jgi:8-oxo-dGTP pyrophosphatase MutT (NUDIX family)